MERASSRCHANVCEVPDVIDTRATSVIFVV